MFDLLLFGGLGILWAASLWLAWWASQAYYAATYASGVAEFDREMNAARQVMEDYRSHLKSHGPGP